MMQSLKELLISWNTDHSERAKLQHAYVVVALVGIVVAGLVGLLNDELGQGIVMVCLVSLGVFLANTVAWALLYSLVITRLPSRRAGNGRK